MSEIIKAFEARVAEECKAVDREAAFNEMLDECYSFEKVGGPFAGMSPSRVLLECDPIAHRCGVNDYCDSLSLVEIGSESYQGDDVEKVRDEMLNELDTKASELEDEDEEIANSDNPPEVNGPRRSEIETELATIKAQIEELRDHSV